MLSNKIIKIFKMCKNPLSTINKHLNYIFKPLQNEVKFKNYQKVCYAEIISKENLEQHMEFIKSKFARMAEVSNSQAPKGLASSSGDEAYDFIADVEPRATEAKIVQHSLVTQLKKRINPFFSENSFGYKSIEEVFGKIRGKGWQSNKFFIKAKINGSISQPLSQVLKDILPSLLDDGALKVTTKLLDLGDIKIESLGKDSIEKSSLVHILTNIYLHVLDTYIEDILKIKWNVGKSRASEPKIFRRLRYIRHDNNILMGYIGTHEEAVDIVNSLKSFLINKMMLRGDEGFSINITPAEGGTDFLGAHIVAQSKNTYTLVNRKEK